MIHLHPCKPRTACRPQFLAVMTILLAVGCQKSGEPLPPAPGGNQPSASAEPQKGSTPNLPSDTGGGVTTPSATINPFARAAARTRSANNLKQIALAMHAYHSDHGSFPSPAIDSKDGKPLLSWRVTLLPYLEENTLYQEFQQDQPWDSEHNQKLLSRIPKVYQAPLPGTVKDPSLTFYQVFVGKDCVFEEHQHIGLLQITDGSSNTILVVEAGEPVPWTKPEDLSYAADKPLPRLGGWWDGYFLAAFADGSVHRLKAGAKEQSLRLAITRNDGEPLPRDLED